MKRIFKIGTGSVIGASTVAIALALAGPGTALAATTQRHSTTAQATLTVLPTSTKAYPLPKTATWYRAGVGGSVKVAAVNAGTIKVLSVSTAKGYRATIDTASGSSLDVYFRHGGHTIKFEAEINDSGGLTVLVTRR